MPKMLPIGQILTTTEMKEALRLYKRCESHLFADRCAAEIISPVLERINKITGQENDARYLAYAVQHSILKSNGNLHS